MITAILGLFIGLSAILVGNYWEGGHLEALFQPTAGILHLLCEDRRRRRSVLSGYAIPPGVSGTALHCISIGVRPNV